MNLLHIKQHMMRVKVATLASLCDLLRLDADTVRCLLSHWIRKGCIKACLKTTACGSKCQKCPVAITEIYEWVRLDAVA